MQTIEPANVREVGFIDPPLEEGDSFIGVSTTLLEGEFQDQTIKGMQVGPYLMWFLPEEADQIGSFLLGAA